MCLVVIILHNIAPEDNIVLLELKKLANINQSYFKKNMALSNFNFISNKDTSPVYTVQKCLNYTNIPYS